MTHAATAPKRIQLSRKKGWRKPEGAVIVARPSKWGNWYKVERSQTGTRDPSGRGFLKDGPWIVIQIDKWGMRTGAQWGAWDDKVEATTFAVELHRRAMLATRVSIDGLVHHEHYLRELRGKDLACWCPLGQPCHADTLLDLANA